MNDEFFEPVPSPRSHDEEREIERKPWWGPPQNVVGGVVPVSLTMANTGDVALHIDNLTAYPTGFGFSLQVIYRTDEISQDLDPDLWDLLPSRVAEDPERGLRFGVQFADGTKGTNVNRFPEDLETEPELPVLWSGRSGGSGARYVHESWVWPLPPPGPLAFVVRWNDAGIPQTRREIDAELVIEAAARSETLWPQEPLRGTGTWVVDGGSIAVVREPSEEDDE